MSFLNFNIPTSARFSTGATRLKAIHGSLRNTSKASRSICTAVREFDVPDILKVFEQVCHAVQYAHRRLVVHRDLKPANILVMEGGLVKLLDFGISKPLEEESVTSTIERRFMPAYASPEQIRGEPITAATDVYALGLLLYELLAGFLPHATGSVEDMVRRLQDKELPPPSEAAGLPKNRQRAIRGDLDRIVLHALERDPERRYPSVEWYRAGYPISAQRPTAWHTGRESSCAGTGCRWRQSLSQLPHSSQA